jgi:two-component system, LuxR family, response regulator FixJ
MRELESTVFILDDDTPVLKGLEALMESVRLRAEVYLSADDFFRNYDPARPGCLILDVRMPGASGIEVYRRLRDEGSDIPVIFLTGYGDVGIAVGAMREGAFDFLEKHGNDQYLIDRVQAALAQDRANRRRNHEHSAIAGRLSTLSPRELQVVDQLLSGKTSKVIARDLGVGLKTVDFHRVNIMRKLGVETIADLVYLLVKNGYSRENQTNSIESHSPLGV